MMTNKKSQRSQRTIKFCTDESEPNELLKVSEGGCWGIDFVCGTSEDDFAFQRHDFLIDNRHSSLESGDSISADGALFRSNLEASLTSFSIALHSSAANTRSVLN
ncbi:hypothetical protein Mapa_013695 [Marchantia paleacea]|nr:hypothetical protein Mapa_013695 [Marchantia paleacea]